MRDSRAVLLVLGLTLELAAVGCGTEDPDDTVTASAASLTTPMTSETAPTTSSATTTSGASSSTTGDITTGEVSTGPMPTSGDETKGSTGTTTSTTTGPTGTPSAVVIDFDDLSHYAAVSDQYEHAMFSSGPNCKPVASVGANIANTSTPYFLYMDNTNNSCPNPGEAPLYIDFSSPVYDLKWSTALIDTDGVVGRVRVFQLGIETALVDIVGQGDSAIPVATDLSAYPGITRIEVVDVLDIESYGIAFDDLSFTVYL